MIRALALRSGSACRARRGSWPARLCAPPSRLASGPRPSAATGAEPTSMWGVPDIEMAHRRECAHLGPVRLGGGLRGGSTVAGGERPPAAGDDHAGGQTLDVPLERRRQRLVEVVDVEHEPALRRGEDAEVQQVRVSAGLDAQTRRRRALKSRAITAAARGETQTATHSSADGGSSNWVCGAAPDGGGARPDRDGRGADPRRRDSSVGSVGAGRGRACVCAPEARC